MNFRKRLFNLVLILAFCLAIPVVSIPDQTVIAQGPDWEEPGKSTAEEVAAPEITAISPQATYAFSGGPYYDSGWVSLGLDQARTLQHNLGGVVDSYLVNMEYRNSGAEGINIRYYGGADFGASPSVGHLANDRIGAYWRSLTTSSITVYRRPEDTYAEEVRIRIWVDSTPNYDSGWVSLAVDTTSTLTMPLTGDPDDYVVDMQYQSASSGINQRYMGGADFGSNVTVGSPDDRVGAYWRTLTSNSIVVYRRPEDTYAEKVRVRVWIRPRPTYDSGWVSISQNQVLTLLHHIGGNSDDYLVDMQFRAADVNGTNGRAYGGMDVGSKPSTGQVENDRVGAYWRSLTNNSIAIYRRPEDMYAAQVRIRIFHYWDIPDPDYDSSWVNLAATSSITLTHDLGGDANSYLVDFQYRSASVDGIHQRYYGGSDFGDSITLGSPNDRVGAYWRNLTATSISVYRRPEDTYAPQVRVRIWRAPKPDYDSGWVSLAVDTIATLTHSLKGNYQTEYFVAFDYRNTLDGINQRYYGGADFGSFYSYGGSNNTRTGAYWRNLTAESITVYRRPDDVFASDVRIRIWRIDQPDYNSGWYSLDPDEAKVLAHNLTASPDTYLVQVFQYDGDAANLLNQRHYGGADFGNLPPSGYLENDRVGSYWRSLTGQSITVYRRPEDGFADWVSVRIWVTSNKVYLPVIMR